MHVLTPLLIIMGCTLIGAFYLPEDQPATAHAPPPMKSLCILYRPEVNIVVHGLEKFHPFDSAKYQKIHAALTDPEWPLAKGITWINDAEQATTQDLLTIHTPEYLTSLRNSDVVMKIIELRVNPFRYVWDWLSHPIIHYYLITPMLYHVGATLRGAELALQKGAAICLSGGQHHASAKRGMGWCMLGDIQISIRQLMLAKRIRRAMVIDLDYHQGNGYARDKKDGVISDDVFIMDYYGGLAFDADAIEGVANISRHWGFSSVDGLGEPKSAKYMAKLKTDLDEAFGVLRPDLVYYNAGTDTLQGDPLGDLGFTAEQIAARDAMVFEKCRAEKVPIVMLLSGGYAQENWKVIADSIKGLVKGVVTGQ